VTEVPATTPAVPTTTGAGIPAASDALSLSIGPDGPVVLQDYLLVEQLAQFNRERVPERVVHAKGAGAFGRFEVTNDVSDYTRAAVFQPGTTTETLVRFSTVAGELGSPDTWRDPRGFAVKFYTTEGNYDLVGNNTPVFFIRDPMKFGHFIRSQKRRPDNGLRDNDMQWDFWTLSPESAHQVTWLMGDRGIPRTLRHMNGYGAHTFLWVNAAGRRVWVKYHFKTDQGIENLTQAEADALAGQDGDAHRRDLWQAIGRGEYPSWVLHVQIMPFEDAATYRFNPFDVTKVWPHADYPLVEVGTLTLDRNPVNVFAELEQASFEPSNLVPGIGPSPDKMLLGRLFAYPDAHRYRIGPNYLQLPVNAPRGTPAASYTFDGPMRFAHSGSSPVYAPNSYGGPAADPARAGDSTGWGAAGELVRQPYTLHLGDDDAGQARLMIRQVWDDDARERFVATVSAHLRDGVSAPVLQRAFEYWRAVDAGIAERIEEAVRGTRPGSRPGPG
jgi:catalase